MFCLYSSLFFVSTHSQTSMCWSMFWQACGDLWWISSHQTWEADPKHCISSKPFKPKCHWCMRLVFIAINSPNTLPFHQSSGYFLFIDSNASLQNKSVRHSLWNERCAFHQRRILWKKMEKRWQSQRKGNRLTVVTLGPFFSPAFWDTSFNWRKEPVEDCGSEWLTAGRCNGYRTNWMLA